MPGRNSSRSPFLLFVCVLVLALVLATSLSFGLNSLIGDASAFVYERSKTSAPTPFPQPSISDSPDWTGSGVQSGAYFGGSVSTAGDVDGDGYSDLLVGAASYDNGESNEGRAYLYLGSASGLATTESWKAESNQPDAWFGFAVSMAGDIDGDGYGDVLVGAYDYSNGESQEGRAYLYRGSSSGLLATPDWTAEGDQVEDEFGYTVFPAGDVNGDGYSDVLVGDGSAGTGIYMYLGSASGLSSTHDWLQSESTVSPAGDVNADGFSDVIAGSKNFFSGLGRATCFLGSSSGLSTTTSWTTYGDQADCYFGTVVSSAGDANGDGYSDVFVSASGYDNGEDNEGRLYLYFGSGSGLATTPAWVTESNFGIGSASSLYTGGDINGDGYGDVVVGAHTHSNGHAQEGRIYAYLGSESGLGSTPVWSFEGGQTTAWLGISVCTSGDVNGDGFSDFVAGGPLVSGGGAAYVFHGAPSIPALTPAWISESNQATALLGFSVASAGDVNGDGFSDVIAGAPQYTNSAAAEGAAFLHLGSASGLSATADWIGLRGELVGLFGDAVAGVGDVNGDGYEDIVVGAFLSDNGESDEGRAFLFLGSADGLHSTPAWTGEGNQVNANYAHSVSGAGDVNGDGFGDVIVHSPHYDNEATEEGRAYVYLGSPAGLAVSPHWTKQSDQTHYTDVQRDQWVSSAGDVNGDGYSDVLVAWWWYDNGESDEGRVLVYHGSVSGLESYATSILEGNQANATFGMAVASAGDVNSDGYSDILIGANGFDNGESNEGRLYLYTGSVSGLNLAPAWTYEPDYVNARVGESLASAGDLNGDEYSDVIAGGHYYSNGESSEGGVAVFMGSSSGLSDTPDWTFESNQANAYLGAVAGVGDINGDGFADIVIGAANYDNGEADEGRIAAFYGSGNSGALFLPRQAQPPSGFSLIGPLGVSNSETEFQIQMTGRTPWGRDKVKLQWEVESVGDVFSPLPLITGQSAFWANTGTSGVNLKGGVTGLVAGTAYHWRARLLYQPGNPFGLVSSRWFTPSFNSVNETDFRTKQIYPAPSLTTINPSEGSQHGGTALSVSGSNLRPGAKLYIGPFLATGLSVAGNGNSLSGTSAPGSAGIHDVVVVNPDGQQDRLVGAFTYTAEYIDYTTTSMTGDTGDGWGEAWGDYDNDGDEDLFVTNSGANLLYQNNGTGSFSNVIGTAFDSGVPTLHSRGCAWADYDNDGYLDLYVVNTAGGSNILWENDGDGTFTDVTSTAAVSDGTRKGMGCAWADIDNDGDVDLFVSNVGRDSLYRNNNDGTFTDITVAAGMSDTASGQGCSFADFDLDGDQDLYVCNIAWKNFLYQNDGTGSFTEVSSLFGVDVWANSQGVVWADTDNDGDLDLYVTTSTNNKFFESQAAQVVGGSAPSPVFDWYFFDNSFLSELDDGWSGRGCSAGDWNNDGLIDFYIVNVDFTGIAGPAPVAWQNKMFQNNGDGTFTDITDDAGTGEAGPGHAGASGDIETNGFMDLYVVNDGIANVMFQNQGGGGHWLIVKLEGAGPSSGSNVAGIGAKVEVTTHRGSIPFTQTRWVTAGGGYLSEDSMPLEFGLGTDTRVEVTVTWPSGIVDHRTVRPVDRMIKILEGASEFGGQDEEDSLRKKPDPTLGQEQ